MSWASFRDFLTYTLGSIMIADGIILVDLPKSTGHAAISMVL